MRCLARRVIHHASEKLVKVFLLAGSGRGQQQHGFQVKAETSEEIALAQPPR